MSFGNERDRQRCNRDYLNFRRRFPKTDVTFLDAEGRRQRVCETKEEVEAWVNGLLTLANEAKEKGELVTCILDVEGDYVIPGKSSCLPEPFFWHKRRLRAEGVSAKW